MRKDLTRSLGPRNELPVQRRPGFFSPWFEDLWNNPLSVFSEPDFLAPALDIDETDREFIVSTDLPGIKKEDINIECSGDQLTITAERKVESKGDRKQGRRERFYGTYQRSFTLPPGVKTDQIQASYEGGVLTLNLPKGEQEKPQKIKIGESKKMESEAKH